MLTIMVAALMFVRMDSENARLTIELPKGLHEKFLRKCFDSRPRTTMRERIVAFIAAECGEPMPKLVDRRKLTQKERAALDAKRKPSGK